MAGSGLATRAEPCLPEGKSGRPPGLPWLVIRARPQGAGRKKHHSVGHGVPCYIPPYFFGAFATSVLRPAILSRIFSCRGLNLATIVRSSESCIVVSTVAKRTR